MLVLVDVLVMEWKLEFSMILGHDYVYSMNDILYIIFHVMHFLTTKSLSLLINLHSVIPILI